MKNTAKSMPSDNIYHVIACFQLDSVELIKGRDDCRRNIYKYIYVFFSVVSRCGLLLHFCSVSIYDGFNEMIHISLKNRPWL